MDSAQIRRLKKEHREEIEEDVSDNVMSILGTAVHEVLSRYCDEESIPETRLFANVNGKTISGQIDLLEKQPGGFSVVDYKTTSASSIRYNPDGKPEWEKQLNLYAFLAEQNDIPVVGLDVVVIIRDWSKTMVSKSEWYPKQPILRIPIPFWTKSETEEYIIDRLNVHEDEKSLCTADERWQRPAKFAVYAGKTKRARKLFNKREDAEDYEIMLAQSDTRIEKRPAESVRCRDNFCGVARFCEQYKTVE